MSEAAAELWAQWTTRSWLLRERCHRLINDGAIYCFTHWLLDILSRPAPKQAADAAVDRSRSKANVFHRWGNCRLLLPHSTSRSCPLLPDQPTCSGFQSEAEHFEHEKSILKHGEVFLEMKFIAPLDPHQLAPALCLGVGWMRRADLK